MDPCRWACPAGGIPRAGSGAERAAAPGGHVCQAALAALTLLTAITLLLCAFLNAPPAWSRWPVLIGACVVLLQGGLVATYWLYRQRRRAAEEALRGNQGWISLVADAANVAAWSWDVSRNRIRRNPHGAQMDRAAGCVERTYEEFLSSVHPDDRGRVMRLPQSCLAPGERFECEFRMSRPDGTIRWINSQGRCVADADGARHIRGISVDVTDRKESELALQQSEARYRSIVEDQADLICRFLPDGTLTFVNRAYCRYFNHRAADLIGRTFWPFIPAEDHEAARRHFASFAPDRPLATREHRVTLANGEIRWHLWTNRAFFDEQGRLFEFQSVGRDITERRQAEDQRALLAAMVASSDDAIITLDLQGCVTSWNAAAVRLFGGAASEVHGKEAWHLLAPEGVEELLGVFRRAKAGRSVSPVETTGGDGGVRSLSLTASPIRNDSGQVTGVSMGFRDVSERKRLELEVELLRRELAHVGRVTMMGELTASLAHELNQPLTAILSNAQAGQTYLGASQQDEVREILRDIATDAERAGEVIKRMRRLMKKGEVGLAAVDVNEIVREAVLLIRSEGIIRNVAIDLDLTAGLSPARGDRVQLQQVLLNLMLNGLEAMARESETDRRLVVRTARQVGGAVRVAVRDAGVGFPGEALARAFEPFFSTKADGMGMGLAITRSIVLAHGGQIWASNNPDRGATIWFELPALDEQRAAGDHDGVRR